MDRKDEIKIQILLTEYNSLREDLFYGRTHVLNVVGISVTALLTIFGIYLSAKDSVDIDLFIGISIGLCMSILVAVMVLHMITAHLTKRLRAIEIKINELVGDEVILWENVYGWGGVVPINPKNQLYIQFINFRSSVMTPTHLRLISFLEGVSFIVLLGVAMPLKYKFDKPFLVPYAGMAHGVLFIAFIVALLVVCQLQKWSLKVFVLGLIASVVPFAPFWFERYVYRLSLADEMH